MDPLSARYSLLAFEIGDLNGAWFVKKGNRRKKEVLAVHRNPIAYRKVPADRKSSGVVSVKRISWRREPLRTMEAQTTLISVCEGPCASTVIGEVTGWHGVLVEERNQVYRMRRRACTVIEGTVGV